LVAGGAGGVSLGEAGGVAVEEQGQADGVGGAAAAVGGLEPNASGGGSDLGRPAAGGGGPLREGDQELLARLVPLLRVEGHPANEQRPGTPVWQPSLSRAACERPEAWVAGLGGGGLCARGVQSGNAAATGRGVEVVGGVCGGLASV